MSLSAKRPRRVVLGVSGGIAAYKSAELVRALTAAGIEVQVVMTAAASQFVGAMTFQALTGRPVRSGLFDPAAEAAMGHIELARWGDLVLIAPASADVLARLAGGHADDLLTTACLASPAPLAVAPAMNQQMWAAPATRRNVERLRADGVLVWGPGSGDQACGDVGPGRMLEPADLASRALEVLHASNTRSGPLTGRKVLITAGPTREAIDPVRYISNHSSGKQGFALAAAAAHAGAQVVLVAGPVDLPTPGGVRRVDVQSALDMLQACQREVTDSHIVIGVAAVADYRVEQTAAHKLKKSTGGAGMLLTLVENPDIIATLAAAAEAPFCVGFAAETRDVVSYARAKLASKHLDLIVANDVSDTSIGFGSDSNAVTLIWSDGERALPRMPKDDLSRQLVEIIADRYRLARSDTTIDLDARTDSAR